MKLVSFFLLVLIASIAACSSDADATATPTTPVGVISTPDPMSVGGLVDGRPDREVWVLGFVVADSVGAKFCTTLFESLPPLCGGHSVDITGHDDFGIQFEEAQGVRWTDGVVIFRGRYADGTFTALETRSP